MAVIEAAISSSLMHPNLVQTLTYAIKPIRESPSSSSEDTSAIMRMLPEAACGFEVQIILEYCDRGTLLDALDQRAFFLPDGSVNYSAVLGIAIDVAKGMVHLHAKDIIHGDLKVSASSSLYSLLRFCYCELPHIRGPLHNESLIAC